MSDELKMQYYEEDEDSDGLDNPSFHDIAGVLNQGDARGSSSGQVEAETVHSMVIFDLFIYLLNISNSILIVQIILNFV